MTLGHLVSRVRIELNDTYESSYRWATSRILTFLVQGIERLNKVRPESRYVGMRLADNAFPVTDESDTSYDEATALAYVPTVEDRWMESLIYFAKAKCLEIDSSDVANAQLSSNAYATFERLAMT